MTYYIILKYLSISLEFINIKNITIVLDIIHIKEVKNLKRNKIVNYLISIFFGYSYLAFLGGARLMDNFAYPCRMSFQFAAVGLDREIPIS